MSNSAFCYCFCFCEPRLMEEAQLSVNITTLLFGASHKSYFYFGMHLCYCYSGVSTHSCHDIFNVEN